ncbi:MAG: hydrogenase, partial [Candidatus Omnitrophota bacterium]
MKNILKNRIAKGIVTRPIWPPDREAQKLGEELRARIHKRFGRSFHIREVDTGSCGACESE